MTQRLSFVAVSDESESHLIPFVDDVFTKLIVPVYGPQEKALELIRRSADRHCDVLLVPTESTPCSPAPLGLVVYKLQPTAEFAPCGLTNSVEIKTLCLADPSKSSGKGYGSALLDRVIEYAKSLNSNSLHVTVSDSRPDSRSFFIKKGFRQLIELPNPPQERLYSMSLT